VMQAWKRGLFETAVLEAKGEILKIPGNFLYMILLSLEYQNRTPYMINC
jgi:hypothetical protein